jgi:predicted membrane protein
MDSDRFERRFERRMERMQRHRHHSAASGIIFGGLIVAIGLFLLLDNLHIIRARDVWQFWPLILVAFGLARIVESRSPARLLWGGLIAGVGALLFLDNLDLLPPFLDFNVIWPVVLIAFGGSMLFRAVERRKYLEGVSATEDTGGSWVAIFSGGKRRIDSGEFRHADVLAIFGGFQVDLRGATIPAEEAVIDVNALFGGVEIRVPETWTVLPKCIGVFGGIDDKTIPPKLEPGAKGQRLVITGAAVFGGVSIRN